MTFQVIAYAQRVSTGTPLSKLIFIQLVGASFTDGYADVDVDRLVAFTHATREEVLSALRHLQAMGLIYWPPTDFRHPDDWACCIVKLPLSEEAMERRKRPKLTVDQFNKIAEFTGGRCAACGDGETEPEKMHPDHIIPRSRGGADVEANLQLLCPKCNARKHARQHWIDFL